MTEGDVLQAAKMAQTRGITFEIAQRGELLGEKVFWPGIFSIWLLNPRTGMVHRMDELHQAEAACNLEVH
jgi:hypothetical protein